MIDLKYEAPDDELKPFVSSFYRIDYDGIANDQLERADRAQFRVLLRGQAKYHFPAGHHHDATHVTIIGPTTAPVTTHVSDVITIVGWGMTPLGWAVLMGNEAAKWVDDCFDAARIYGDAMADLRLRLIEAPDIETQFRIAKEAAAEIFAKSETAPFEFTAVVDDWLLSVTDHNIDALVQSTGLSIRQLERTTTRYYGMPPKKLARKYRALRAAHKLAAGDSLDDTELGLAFYDQSHLIREVKIFTGLTPSQLKSGRAELTAATIRERGKLGNAVSPLVSES
jgi:AraC-like DNA-binding protein